MVEWWTPESSLARFIDHTLLKPTATEGDILKLCKEAVSHKFFSVCVNGSWVSYCRKQLAGSDVRISAVCGFPLGAMSTKTKVFEAANAVEDGAKEIDMVLSIGDVIDGRYDKASADIAAVVKAVEKRAIVKVILETGYLDDRQKTEACAAAEAAGAHYVKTSTGFGHGGATEADIRLMRSAVSAGTGVKASGGIRDRETAILMLRSGANRLGTSAGIAIVTPTSASKPDGSTPEGQSGSSIY
ncbi:deoxyribose-phosphate aldolase [Paenibacillus nasutitermitis]|uniref:Deoxyribose-phosphate aldolase n=1 Tax=Paenibacillus nasutitermitis TaxID=1652958 RepID=A0A916Z1L9_9BACL|nr:deoxyribose-phosphate aldolase [Paenibacillus nasutitermitis]GGD71586.1 deoxyribose-phosphate aldolase [Paenibacillus nasutitermitis]